MKNQNSLEDLEIMINTLYSNCKNNEEIYTTYLSIARIVFKEEQNRRKELKNGFFK